MSLEAFLSSQWYAPTRYTNMIWSVFIFEIFVPSIQEGPREMEFVSEPNIDTGKNGEMKRSADFISFGGNAASPNDIQFCNFLCC